MLPSALGPEIPLHLPVNDLRPLYRALRCARMAQDGRGHLYPLARGSRSQYMGNLSRIFSLPGQLFASLILLWRSLILLWRSLTYALSVVHRDQDNQQC